MNINHETSTLIDVQYIKPSKSTGYKDYLYLILRDEVSNQKVLQTIENPKMDIYFTKPEFRSNKYPQVWEDVDKLDKKTVEYSKVLDAIAQDGGNKSISFLRNARMERDRRKSELLYAYPYSYGADIDIRTWYRLQWLSKFNNGGARKITKGFYDIEVDGSKAKNSSLSPQDCPVNCVTAIDPQTRDVYTFVLTEGREEDPQVINFCNNIEKFIADCHKEFDSTYGDFTYRIYTYDNESKMIVHLFQLFNQLKLDIVGSWSYFDIEYLNNRIRALGMDPRDVICHPDFKVKECYFKKDTRHFAIKLKTDHFFCSSYTTYVDQMKTYAAIRKGQQELRKFSLNAIAEAELGDKKIDYAEDGNIKTLPYTNFWKFVLYNIKDVLLQHGIENKVHDFDNLFLMSFRDATPFESVFKQTVKVANVRYRSFMNQGVVSGNNINRLYLSEEEIFQIENEPDDEDEEDEELEDEDNGHSLNGGKTKDVGYEGALVADPLLNGYYGEYLYGQQTNYIFKYVIDEDMTAFYPSSIMAMNIDPSCLIFKVIVFSDQFKKDKICNTIYPLDSEVGKEVFDNYQTGNKLSTGHKWLNLPSVEDVYARLKERLS